MVAGVRKTVTSIKRAMKIDFFTVLFYYYLAITFFYLCKNRSASCGVLMQTPPMTAMPQKSAPTLL